MLQAMAPHCLRTYKEDRHSYQIAMADAIEKTLTDVKSEQNSVVDAAREGLATAELEKASAAARLESATEQVEACSKQKEEKDSNVLALEAALQESGNAVSRAQESEKNLEIEQAKVIAEINECKELMANTWASLKNATFPGQQWRERNKTIDLLMQALDKMGLDVSLKAALPTALKIKPSERGRFASKAVEFAEGVMAGYLSSLTKQVENSTLEAAARANVTASAIENQSAAEQQLEEGKTAAAVAKEQLTHALAIQKAIEVELQAAPRKLQKLASALEKQELSLARIEAVFSTFLSLKERSKPAVEIPSPCEHLAAEVLVGECLISVEAQ